MSRVSSKPNVLLKNTKNAKIFGRKKRCKNSAKICETMSFIEATINCSEFSALIAQSLKMYYVI